MPINFGKTVDLDAKLKAIFAQHPGTRGDLKTKRFINGAGAWNQVPAQERRDFLRGVCQLAVDNGGKVYGVALSYDRFDAAIAAGHGHPFGTSYWIAGAMLVSALVQKKMQGVANSKGLTVFIMDDNKQEMAALSDGLYRCHDWYDGLYQRRGTKRGRSVWRRRTCGTHTARRRKHSPRRDASHPRHTPLSLTGSPCIIETRRALSTTEPIASSTAAMKNSAELGTGCECNCIGASYPLFTHEEGLLPQIAVMKARQACHLIW